MSISHGKCDVWPLWSRKGDFDKALADLNKAIELTPNSAEAYHDRGWAYLLKGDLDEAVADFNRAVDMEPSYAEAYCNRGLARKGQGRRAEAIADLGKCIELTSDANLRDRAGRALNELGAP